MTEEDQKMFRDFNDFVKNFNDYICREWDNRVQNRQGEVSKEDIQTVEEFIDIEDSQ
jgi:6-pyruvoyl-tetrahydropterin synthase